MMIVTDGASFHRTQAIYDGRNTMKQLLLFLIRIYQKGISPMLPPTCRFLPTCSNYAIEAITLHGSIKGSWLALCRILRCHPFCRGGYDPVKKLDN